MKQYQITNAYRDLEKLSENEFLTDKNQWEIYKLRKQLRSHVEFQQERENAIREKYMAFANDKGILEGEKSLEYVKEMQDLSQLDVEIENFTKPTIKTVKGVTCKTIEALEDFVEFTEPEE